MKCNQILPLLSGHLDGANSEIEERRLQQHLKTCRHCRELLTQMEENDALLASQEAQPPADLTNRIMSQIRKEEKKPRLGKRFIVSTAATGLAAAALLAFVVWSNVSLPKSSDSAPEMAALDNANEYERVAVSEMEAGSNTDENILNDTLTADTGLYGSTGLNGSGSTPADTWLRLEAPETEPATTQGTLLEKTDAVVADSSEPAEPAESITAIEPTQDTYFEPSPPPIASIQDENATDESVEPPPMYAYSGQTAENLPPKRGTAKQKPVEGPVLVIWKTDAAEIAGLSDYTLSPVETTPAETAPADILGDNLYTRMKNGLFLRPQTRDDGQETSLAVTTCTVDYEALTALFDECAGTYELCVYYPASIKSLEKCTVLLVEISTKPADKTE